MDIIQKFIELTEFTIPFGYEDTLLSKLPSNINKDEYGNYYLSIGDNPNIMFCSHLDSFCTEYKKVNHIITQDKIKTDGNTILGADNKAGVTILLNMIENNIDGLYYFFIGEESIPDQENKGLYGASRVAASEKYNEQINIVISFDRKKQNSIISKQLDMVTCSDSFVSDLTNLFNEKGMVMYKDTTGICTDSAAFLYYISECTNISNGTYNEHTNDEYLDINYFTKLNDAVINIEWEKLKSYRTIPKLTIDNSKPINYTDILLMKYTENNRHQLLTNGCLLLTNNNTILVNKYLEYIDIATKNKIKININDN